MEKNSFTKTNILLDLLKSMAIPINFEEISANVGITIAYGPQMGQYC